jgi:hypothetical protein
MLILKAVISLVSNILICVRVFFFYVKRGIKNE